MKTEDLYEKFLQCSGFTTDSRKIGQGTMFFALRGEKFDGNAFVAEAFEKGASYCVIDNPDYRLNDRCILTDDTLKAMQQLAIHHRRQFNIPVIEITGTNGKTTTKELLYAVLSQKYRTHATQGNLNNHIGVPLTLLAMPKDTEIAIVETGANHPGEIDFLANIVQPTFGLITNVGKAHLEGFGSFEGVVNTKTELYRYLAENGGTLFVNADNDILMRRSENQKRVTYGKSADVGGHLLASNPYMAFSFEAENATFSVQTQLLGDYNFDNAMAAVCVGLHFGIAPEQLKSAIGNYTPTNNRSQFKRTARNRLYLDCYNANPSSMTAAVRNFGNQKDENRVVMLGGMKELGADSMKEHRNIVQLVENCHFAKNVFVGEEFSFVKGNNASTLWFATSSEAREHFSKNRLENCTILVKGSNSTKMWILEEIL